MNKAYVSPTAYADLRGPALSRIFRRAKPEFRPQSMQLHEVYLCGRACSLPGRVRHDYGPQTLKCRRGHASLPRVAPASRLMQQYDDRCGQGLCNRVEPEYRPQTKQLHENRYGYLYFPVNRAKFHSHTMKLFENRCEHIYCTISCVGDLITIRRTMTNASVTRV